MSINSISSVFPGTSNAVSSTGPKMKDEKDMFMTLLVAQLKNQDPLQPQDGTQFVAQLAQFNSLDQLVGIRESIEQLTTMMSQSRQA